MAIDNTSEPAAPGALVQTRVEGRVGVLVLNNPGKMNTLDIPMLSALDRALEELQADRRVRVIVVIGCDDRSFMAGGNLAHMNTLNTVPYYEEFSVRLHEVFRRFELCLKPTIAAVNGWALGGGCEFMLTLDLRIMAEQAQLGLPEVKLGIFPGGGGTQRLIRQISLCDAKWMMFTGDFVSAEQARRLGLVNKVVPRERLMPEAMALAARIASHSSSALQMMKRAIVQGREMPLAGALAHEAALIAMLFDTRDAHEGMSAFLQKRPPDFAD